MAPKSVTEKEVDRRRRRMEGMAECEWMMRRKKKKKKS